MDKKLQNAGESAQNKRSSKEIEQDLAARGEQFSRTVEQLGERIEEKLDWRGYVRKSPFWALGAATGLGVLAAGLMRRRTTPLEQLLESINSSVRGSLTGIAGPGLVKVTLLGVAARAATQWLKKVPAVAAVTDTVEDRTDPAPDGTRNDLESEAGGFEPPMR